MLQNVLIFIVFLTPLIFFHELGHFLFARFFGVRVEVFSIGFGKKLFKYKKDENSTEYAVSMIPLGGYVKMFGDDPLNADAIPEEERQHAFTHKNKWERFWIVFGGPLANFILAFVILYMLLLTGEKVPEATFGYVPSNSFFNSYGVTTADKLTKVNGEEIVGLTDLSMKTSDGFVKSITIKRNNVTTKIPMEITSKQFFENFLKLSPIFRKPVVVNKQGEAFAVSFDSQTINWTQSLDTFAVINSKGTGFYLHPLKIPVNLDNDIIIEKKRSIPISVGATNNIESFVDLMAGSGYYPMDLMVNTILMNDPADKAGLFAKDILVSMQGIPLYGFEDLRLKMQKFKPKEKVTFEYLRNGKLESVTLVPKVTYEKEITRKTIGIQGTLFLIAPRFIQTKGKGFGESAPMALKKTWESIIQTLQGYKRLITGSVSLKNVGGPLAIGKVAADSLEISLSYFFKLMALISVNLGVINLFPIPVLDGGHIMFIILELLKRGPLSRRTMEVAQQFGVSLLLLLIVAAIFNDITRLL